MKLGIVYFSATHVTKSYAEAIQQSLQEDGCEAALVDITSFTARQTRLPVESYDGFAFGFPVFADFPPSVVCDWFGTLEGEGKPCAVFATYGGRTSGYAPYHAWSLLAQAGFRVQFLAEFLGRHSFNLAGWNLMSDRPNDVDFRVAFEFARLARERLAGEDRGIILQKPFGYDGAAKAMRTKTRGPERSWSQPVRVRDCGLCGTCAENCPTQAMNSATGKSDPFMCIECMHCVHLCPEQALQTDSQMGAFYPTFVEQWNLAPEILAGKRSKIITEAWQTVA